MSLFSAYRVDRQAEAEGVWKTFRGGVSVQVRSIVSAPAVEAQKVIDKRNRQYFQSVGEVPPEVQVQNEVEMASAVTVDWKATDDEAKPIVCTDATKAAIFGDPEMRDFRQEIIGVAANPDTYRRATLAAARAAEAIHAEATASATH